MSRTTYICGICNTKPDQLSHHTAHLNTISHKDQKIICEHNLCKYAIRFSEIFGEYRNIMLENEYFAERMNSTNAELPTFQEWVIKKNADIETRYHLNELDSHILTDLVSIYKTETGKVVDYNDKVGHLLYLDWALNRYLKECETIVKTTQQNIFKNCNNEVITKIDNGEIELEELINWFIDGSCNGCEVCNESTNDICKMNAGNLRYILYKIFKDKIVYKSVEVTTIIMGETEVRKQMKWVTKYDNIIRTLGYIRRLFDSEILEVCENVKRIVSNFNRNKLEIILRELCRE